MRVFPAVDSATALDKMGDDQKREGAVPRRKKKSRRKDEDGAVASPRRLKRYNDEGEAPTVSAQSDSTELKQVLPKSDRDNDDSEEAEQEEDDQDYDEEDEELSRHRHERNKSVTWSDDVEGGALSQETNAAAYNRRELSYAPRRRIRFGSFSTFQKRVLIGLGLVFLILIIVVFIVVFVVIKPGAARNSPTAPTQPPFVLSPPS